MPKKGGLPIIAYISIAILLLFVGFIIYVVIKSPKRVEMVNSQFVELNVEVPTLGTFMSKKIPKKKKKSTDSKSELRCKFILEKIFKKKFEKIRPDWLKNPSTGQNLEADMYNESIKTRLGKGLICEVDGAQHSHYIPYFHKTKKDFEYQVAKDKWKDAQCEKMGITMIRVPYYIPIHKLEDFLIEELNKKGVVIP